MFEFSEHKQWAHLHMKVHKVDYSYPEAKYRKEKVRLKVAHCNSTINVYLQQVNLYKLRTLKTGSQNNVSILVIGLMYF